MPMLLFSVIHLFPWSGILDENYELSETFQVPDIKTGTMVKLMTQLTTKEEEMFRNMIRRLNTIVSVRFLLQNIIMNVVSSTNFVHFFMSFYA
jgi:proline dehydrogenase